jgi:hypothetical protein
LDGPVHVLYHNADVKLLGQGYRVNTGFHGDTTLSAHGCPETLSHLLPGDKQGRPIAELAVKNRLPSIAGIREHGR